MIPFPRTEITDEDDALDWWEKTFAGSCEAIRANADAAALVRAVVSSLRDIRQAALDARLTLTAAAEQTGYSTRQISRWVKTGKLENVGTARAPKVRRGNVLAHKKAATLPTSAPIGIVGAAQGIARSVANRKSRRRDG